MGMKHRLSEARVLGDELLAHLGEKEKEVLLAETQRCD